MALCPGLPGRARTKRNIHPLTRTCNHYLSIVFLACMPRQLLYSPMCLLICLLYLSLSQHSRYRPEIPSLSAVYQPSGPHENNPYRSTFWVGFPTSCLHRHVQATTAWYQYLTCHLLGFMVQGKITKADAPTISLAGRHPIQTNCCHHFHHPHHFYTGCPSCSNFPNLCLGHAPSMLACIPWLGFSITIISWKILLTLMGSGTVSISLQNNNTEHCTATVTAGVIRI